ncbi:MAG: beta-lactamase family protein [Eubacterium sp.]|nr:beta-lactamase family protein [Eubacterium sp.]
MKNNKFRIMIALTVAMMINGSGYPGPAAGSDPGMAVSADQDYADIIKEDQGSSIILSDESDEQDDEEKEHFLNIGSVSKMYSVAAVMQLKEKGLVDLDKPLTEYIDDFKMADERYKKITVRMLMNHTSGMMGSQYFDSFRFKEVSDDYHDSFLINLSMQRLKAEPGEYNSYCNDGFTLLEILVERVSGMSFTEYLEENIFEPLNLDSTYTMWDAPDMNQQIPYYTSTGMQMEPECAQLIGAGGAMSTSVDLSRFGSAFFYGEDSLIGDVSKKEMGELNNAAISPEGFGLGWDMVEPSDYMAAGVKVIGKGGDSIFQHAYLAVAPEEKISVAVISSGGSSSYNQELAEELVDIVLEEKGIHVEHAEDELKHTEDKVPEADLQYEGFYSDGSEICRISFPDGKYMNVRSLTSSNPFEVQFLYTEDGSYVEVTGDIESGNAIQVRPLSIVKFEKRDGKVILVNESDSAVLAEVDENKVDKASLDAWNKRNGKSYYLYNAGYSDMSYITMNKVMPVTSPDVEGYVNNHLIVDADHAMGLAAIPGTASRDINDYEIIEENGQEFLTFPGMSFKYISEDAIPVYDSNLKEVSLTTGEASWYRLDGVENETIHLEIPGNAACYIFDKKGSLIYSNHMVGYGNSVPLPSYGMIVFVGETGTGIVIGR